MTGNAAKLSRFIGGFFLILAAATAHAQDGSRELDQAQRLEVEKLLRELGFDPGQVDGVFDSASRFAIRSYQDLAALPADGEASLTLLLELRSVAAALSGMKSAEEEATTEQGAQAHAAQSAPPAEASAPESVAGESPGSESTTAQPSSTEPSSAESATAEPATAEPATAEPATAETSSTEAPSIASAKPEDVAVPVEADDVAGARAALSIMPPKPERKPQPPPRQIARAGDGVERPRQGTGFDLERLMTRLSRSEDSKNLVTAKARQEARLRRQNQDLFQQAYRAGRAGQFGRAIAGYEDLAEHPGLEAVEKAIVLYNLGNLWMELANNLRALESYSAALQLAPDFREALYNRALVLMRLGQKREAERTIAKLRDLGLAWDGRPRPSFHVMARLSRI